MYLEFPKEAGTPPLQLRGFEKTAELAPGAEVEVVFPIRSADLSVWDTSIHDWKLVHGEFKVFVGSSSDDIRVVGSFQA